MVSLFGKKKAHQSVKSSPNQLVQAVSPFLEVHIPSSSPSFRFTKNKTISLPKMMRRKHSSQREQLAQLKASELLLSDSDHELLTGLLPAPARSTPTPNGPEADLAKPIKLRHQATPRASILSTATTKTKKKTMSSLSKMNSSSGRKKYLAPLFRSSTLTSDMFASRGCYGGPLPMSMAAGGCAVMTGAHQVPCIISITHLNDYDEDASSEVSLEDYLYMSTSTATTSLGQTTATETTATSVEEWPFPGACMPRTAADLQSDSSISWPSDEDDDEEEDDEDAESRDNTEDDEENELEYTYDPSSLQLITQVRELTCANEVDSQFMKADLGCGGFKFWSDGAVHKENLVSGSKSDVGGTAARDEENCRDDTADKVREEMLDRLESF